MLSVKHSATCFFNSMFMESPEQKNEIFRGQDSFVIDCDDLEIIIPLSRKSPVGRHEYQSTFFLRSKEAIKEISFQEILALLLKNHLLHERVRDSMENIESSLTERLQEYLRIYEGQYNFQEAEQSLFVGHALHPAPKSKSGFTADDRRLYSPETGGHFPLRWFWVKPECLEHCHSTHFSDFNWMINLWKEEASQSKFREGFVPFPMHPWQAPIILLNKAVKTYLASGMMIEAESGQEDWYPTTSLRTLYRPSARYMLKFSLDVKLTNSIRHLLLHELKRGFQVHEVFHTEDGQKLLASVPYFKVIHEPVYLVLKDLAGRPIKESFVMGRENPISQNDKIAPLALLTQDHPKFGANLIQAEITRLSARSNLKLEAAAAMWFKEFLRIAITPFLMAQSEYGILLGAHQQNLLLQIEDNLPVKSFFRDCHGTGYSPLGHRLFGKEVKSLELENGNILDFEVGNYLFSYYLIINSTFNTIAAICRGGFYQEEELITIFRNELQMLLATNPQDTSCLNYLLKSETLMHKGNYLCSIKDINENTAKNPLDIYVRIKNPFYLKEI